MYICIFFVFTYSYFAILRNRRGCEFLNHIFIRCPHERTFITQIKTKWTEKVLRKGLEQISSFFQLRLGITKMNKEGLAKRFKANFALIFSIASMQPIGSVWTAHIATIRIHTLFLETWTLLESEYLRKFNFVLYNVQLLTIGDTFYLIVVQMDPKLSSFAFQFLR